MPSSNIEQVRQLVLEALGIDKFPNIAESGASLINKELILKQFENTLTFLREVFDKYYFPELQESIGKKINDISLLLNIDAYLTRADNYYTIQLQGQITNFIEQNAKLDTISIYSDVLNIPKFYTAKELIQDCLLSTDCSKALDLLYAVPALLEDQEIKQFVTCYLVQRLYIFLDSPKADKKTVAEIDIDVIKKLIKLLGTVLEDIVIPYTSHTLEDVLTMNDMAYDYKQPSQLSCLLESIKEIWPDSTHSTRQKIDRTLKNIELFSLVKKLFYSKKNLSTEHASKIINLMKEGAELEGSKIWITQQEDEEIEVSTLETAKYLITRCRVVNYEDLLQISNLFRHFQETYSSDETLLNNLSKKENYIMLFRKLENVICNYLNVSELHIQSIQKQFKNFSNCREVDNLEVQMKTSNGPKIYKISDLKDLIDELKTVSQENKTAALQLLQNPPPTSLATLSEESKQKFYKFQGLYQAIKYNANLVKGEEELEEVFDASFGSITTQDGSDDNIFTVGSSKEPPIDQPT